MKMFLGQYHYNIYNIFQTRKEKREKKNFHAYKAFIISGLMNMFLISELKLFLIFFWVIE